MRAILLSFQFYIFLYMYVNVLCLYNVPQARMYKSRIEIIEKLLGVLELDSEKQG